MDAPPTRSRVQRCGRSDVRLPGPPLASARGQAARAPPGGLPHCHEYLDQLRVRIEVLGRALPDDLSTEALDDLVAVYRRWREE